TRPDAWRRWFENVGVDARTPSRGPRYELFSMTAAAATHGGGVALVPLMLVREELARGELVVACRHTLQGERNYYLVSPTDRPDRKPLLVFRDSLCAEVAGEAEQALAISS